MTSSPPLPRNMQRNIRQMKPTEAASTVRPANYNNVTAFSLSEAIWLIHFIIYLNIPALFVLYVRVINSQNQDLRLLLKVICPSSSSVGWVSKDSEMFHLVSVDVRRSASQFIFRRIFSFMLSIPGYQLPTFKVSNTWNLVVFWGRMLLTSFHLI